MNKVPIVWTRESDVENEDFWKSDRLVLQLSLLEYMGVASRLPEFRPQFLIVTSKKALDFALVREDLQDPLSKTSILTFGKQTYQAILAKGLRGILVHGKNGEEFATRLKACYPPSQVWYLSAEKVASRIDEKLSQSGWKVASLVLYRRQKRSFASFLDTWQKLSTYARAVVCFASPGAVEAFAETLETHPLANLGSFHFVVIGPTTKDMLIGSLPTVNHSQLHCVESSDMLSLAEKSCSLADKLENQ